MKSYKIWQAPVFAFFSTQFYRELAREGKGVGFVYMLALLAFSCSISPIKELADFQMRLSQKGREIIEQIPSISINSGALSIDRESPCLVIDSETGQCLMAFDLQGDSSNIEEAKEGNTPDPVIKQNDGDELPVLFALAGKNQMILRNGNTNTRMSFRDIDKLEIKNRDMTRILALAAYLIPALSYAIAVPFAWLGHIIQAFVFSLAGLILAKTISVKIKYESILRIASFALGNVIILDSIVNIFPLDIPGLGLMQVNIPSWGLYKFVIVLVFTLFGVGANLSEPGFQSVSDEANQDHSSH